MAAANISATQNHPPWESDNSKTSNTLPKDSFTVPAKANVPPSSPSHGGHHGHSRKDHPGPIPGIGN